jgi:hypothetical protein
MSAFGGKADIVLEVTSYVARPSSPPNRPEWLNG